MARLKMQVTFLGTGTSQGVPLIACDCEVCTSDDFKNKRLRTSLMIEVDGKVFVFDAGPDFRQQMLRENVKRLDGLIFTHEHKDHVAGLDDVRAFNYKLKRNIDVFATDNVERALKREYHYIFSDVQYPGSLKINLHKIKNEPFTVQGVDFLPIQVLHYKLPVLGFRVGDFTYITDASEIPDPEKEKIKGSKVVVLNALRKEKHISHFTLNEAIELLTELAPEKGYLIHISHQLGTHEEVSKELPDFIELAYDGLKIKMV
jgi:phosphoribosyl 1,2-cyclic phosphate phosphodiesterase